jgi:polyribonucleotide nucleotidyltransferase
VLETDEKGRVKLSMKALAERPAGMEFSERPPREDRGERRERGDRPPRGERAPRFDSGEQQPAEQAVAVEQDQRPQEPNDGDRQA